MKIKFTSVKLLTLLLVTPLLVKDISVAASSAGHQSEEKKSLRRRLVQSEGCILVQVEIRTGGNTSETQWRCELQPNDAEQAGLLFVDLEGIDEADFEEGTVSGITTLLVEDAVIADGALKIPHGSKKNFGKIDKRGPAEDAKKKRGKTELGEVGTSRNLAPIPIGVRKVLVVRVTATDATATSSITTLGGNIFGTGLSSSSVSMSERYNSCSYGETVMTPFNGSTPKVTITNGIIELQISTSVQGKNAFTSENDVTSALKTYLGVSDLSSVFDHVMLCLPPGTKWPDESNPPDSYVWYAYGKLRL